MLSDNIDENQVVKGGNSANSLLDAEDCLKTHKGAWIVGEKVIFQGYDLHIDLADIDWMELYLLGITGRRFTSEQLKLLNAIWVYTSFPDPRIWNNRICALAGSARSSGALGVSAALGVSEANIYGGQPFIRAIEFFQRTQRNLENGEQLEHLVKSEIETRRIIPGYGRPIQQDDERIPYIMNKARSVGLHNGKFVRMAFAVETYLKANYKGVRMNYGGIMAALCADLGFTPREYYLWTIPTFLAGMLPCYIDAIEKPEGSFLPLRCTRIAYAGPSRRQWNDNLPDNE